MRNNHHHAAPPIIELAGVCKRFGALMVIDDLSFTLAAGEALGIVGPNGAGKSTTLNLIAGDYRPSRGHIFFAGTDITAQSGHYRCRAGIGRTSQVPRPFERLTVFENVLVGASYGARGQRQAADRGMQAGTADGGDAGAGRRTSRRADAARAQATRARQGVGCRPRRTPARRHHRRPHRAPRSTSSSTPCGRSMPGGCRSSGSSTPSTSCCTPSIACSRWTTDARLIEGDPDDVMASASSATCTRMQSDRARSPRPGVMSFRLGPDGAAVSAAATP